MDQRIEIHGTSRHDMNGKRGIATDIRPSFNTDGGAVLSQSRYVVTLDSGERFLARLESVRAEPTGGADGARPKPKGKGKKGRRG